MKDYYYKFQYVDGETNFTYQFPADVDIFELAENIKDFLAGCSWNENILDEVFKGEDDE